MIVRTITTHNVDKNLNSDYNVITMLTTIVSVGNSKGIRIPKLLLEESGFKDKVELTAKRGEIKITAPYKKQMTLNEEYILSLSSLSDWNTDEEYNAWAYLQ